MHTDKETLARAHSVYVRVLRVAAENAEEGGGDRTRIHPGGNAGQGAGAMYPVRCNWENYVPYFARCTATFL